jgi:hypothetical protein
LRASAAPRKDVARRSPSKFSATGALLAVVCASTQETPAADEEQSSASARSALAALLRPWQGSSDALSARIQKKRRS